MIDTDIQGREIALRDQQAEEYADFINRSRGEYWVHAQRSLVVQVLKMSRRMRVYDAGAGVGIYTLELARLFPESRFLAVDFSQSSIDEIKKGAVARNRFNIDLLVGSIADFQPEREGFDRVMCIDVLQHLPSHELRVQALRRMYDGLKPGGRIVTSVYRWGGWIKPPTPKEELDHGGVGLYRFAFTPDDLSQILTEAGFKNISVDGIIRMPGRLRRKIPVGMAPLVERTLITMGLFEDKAQYLLASAEK